MVAHAARIHIAGSTAAGGERKQPRPVRMAHLRQAQTRKDQEAASATPGLAPTPPVEGCSDTTESTLARNLLEASHEKITACNGLQPQDVASPTMAISDKDSPLIT